MDTNKPVNEFKEQQTKREEAKATLNRSKLFLFFMGWVLIVLGIYGFLALASSFVFYLSIATGIFVVLAVLKDKLGTTKNDKMGEIFEKIVTPGLDLRDLTAALANNKLIFLDSPEKNKPEDLRVTQAMAEISEALKMEEAVNRLWHIEASLANIFPNPTDRLEFAKRFFVPLGTN